MALNFTKIVNAAQMQHLDSTTINEIGIPSLVLMENAARGVAKAVLEEFPTAKKILVVAGKGNNGGDGIAAARILKNLYPEREIVVFLPYEVDELKEDPRVQYKIAKQVGVKFVKELPPLEGFDLIIDAIFGTGFKPPIKGRWASIVKQLNAAGKPILAVDIPSGISSDNGAVYEPVIKAQVTVTFALPKYGQVLYPASAYCGKVLIRDISIPIHLFEESLKTNLIEVSKLKNLLPKREPFTYKNREGHVLIIGGSPGKTGAVMMAAKAATEAGAGLVTAGVPESLNPIVENYLIEEMTQPLPEVEKGYLHPLLGDFIFESPDYKRFTSLVIGPGMGRYKGGQELIEDFLTRWEKPMVIDADGINNLADLGTKGKELLRNRKIPAVLTPHVGEMQRLTGLYSQDIIHNQIEVARKFATENNCYVVLKAARTVIATPEGDTYVNVRGTPAMAKGGMGDVLSGILGALISKLPLKEALVLGVSLHALAGEISEDQKDTESVRATDVIRNISSAYRFIRYYNPNGDKRKNFLLQY
ncbi:MAG: NAD(P)H-hydrate dehydratase [Aquificae bacterium]|nr:NAD(P)H-hydrate dehydratase [Aquificota bacterium]